jgi:hypothetical protein
MPARFPVSRAAIPVRRRVDPEATGATRVLIFDHTVRRRVWGGVDRSAGTPRQPVTAVHNVSRSGIAGLVLNRTVAAQGGQKRRPDTPSNPRRLTTDPCNKVGRACRSGIIRRINQISVGQRTQPPGSNTQLPERKTHLGVW